MKRLVVLAYVFAVPWPAPAASIDYNCKPSGLVPSIKEWWNPAEFWAGQLKEIPRVVEAAKTAYELLLFERRREQINNQLDAQERKIMGIEHLQVRDAELDLELAKIDREMASAQRRDLEETFAWARRCTEHAQQQLRSSQK